MFNLHANIVIAIAFITFWHFICENIHWCSIVYKSIHDYNTKYANGVLHSKRNWSNGYNHRIARKLKFDFLFLFCKTSITFDKEKKLCQFLEILIFLNLKMMCTKILLSVSQVYLKIWSQKYHSLQLHIDFQFSCIFPEHSFDQK